MQFVSTWETTTGEEIHAFDPRNQALQGRRPVSAAWLVQWLDNKPDSLCFWKGQVGNRFEHAASVNRFNDLSHEMSAPG